MAELLSNKFRKAIEDSDFTDNKLADLYDAVEGMSDEDFKEYMFSNREYFKRNMPAAVDEVAGFQGYVADEPTYGVANIDYEKVTGSPDALDKFYDYDMKDMEYFGSKVGMTGREFMKQMAEDLTKKERHDIAHGNSENSPWYDKAVSYVMPILAPRQQEAIERGEDPSTEDYTLDLLEDAAYMMPYGAAGAKIGTKLATKSPKLANATRKVLTAGENVIAPAVTTVADKLVYDEDDPRGGDVLSPETGIKVAKGWLVNKYMPKLTNRVPAIRTTLEQLGAPTQNLITNRAGDALYESRQAPGAAGMILNTIDKNFIKEAEDKKKREKNKEKAENKYKGKLTRKQLLGEE